MSVRMMIVEDEQIVAADLESMLARMGHDVVAIAASGEEAVDLAHHFRPQVVLMDVQLSGKMSGTEAARLIQQAMDAQIVFVTAYAAAFFRDPSSLPPASLCISKPFSFHQLRASLDAILKAA